MSSPDCDKLRTRNNALTLAGYTYDHVGRIATTTNWTKFGARQGAASTTRKYNERGFMTNKVYADGQGPKDTYTAARQLKSRLGARCCHLAGPYRLR